MLPKSSHLLTKGLSNAAYVSVWSKPFFAVIYNPGDLEN